MLTELSCTYFVLLEFLARYSSVSKILPDGLQRHTLKCPLAVDLGILLIVGSLTSIKVHPLVVDRLLFQTALILH